MSEQLEKTINEALSNQDVFVFKSIDSVNHKPHPYCIGAKHLERNNSMYLGESQIKEMESKHGPMCEMYFDPYDKTKFTNRWKSGYNKCQLPYEDHTSDKVCFLQLKRNAEQKEAQDILKQLVDAIPEKAIDGFAFVETEEKYRIN